ncbi:MAG: Hsp70 family protein [Gammaproteobacteria bacterium]|jgi:molecular chaperone DnaK (HSP70)
MPSPRYIVGIDLGTTHTVVACQDMSEDSEPDKAPAPTRLFEIEQLVAPGEVASKPLLPSFRHHSAKGELAPQDMLLPWPASTLPGDLPDVVIGEWARELGSRVEGRLVASAKSWLSNSQVDRSAAILPWAAAEGIEKVSPVLASASYLNHVRQAWNHAHPDDPLEAQELVLTVPASFDEAARALTVAAANLAGLSNVVLLEEPQAVCYDWYAHNHHRADDLLKTVKLLLVCDVGGGTTDLSLIRVDVKNDAMALTRVGVGDHLMLGGDNVDLALAHIAEQRIVQGGKALNAASLSQLIQQTRKAKELLLSDHAPDTANVTVLGSGARLIGGARRCELTRDEVREIALDGFFPLTDFSARPNKRRSAIVEFGLPYATDAAVSKHIAAFLARHNTACRDALQAGDDQPAVPDAVLFNGGVFNSPTLNERALAVLQHWRQQPVTVLDNPHPDLSVAYGAVAYGQARRGRQLKIGGGSARSYFLLLDDSGEHRRCVCLMPKGTEEGQEMLLTGRKFALRIGQPVSFHLLSSSDDTDCMPGELLDVDAETMIELPPLVALMDAEYDHKKEVEVELVSVLTEVGTLKIECVSLSSDTGRWDVEFQIRNQPGAQQQAPARVDEASLPARFEDAKDKIQTVYGHAKKEFDPKAVRHLRNDLEKLLGKRDQWDMPLLRALFDALIEGKNRRRRSSAHERIWFNLTGYALRPGFGYPLDEWRIQQLWPLYQQGLQFTREIQSWSEWWTCWRRAAGGLNQQQQQIIFDDIAPYINPVTARRLTSARDKNKSAEDMLRLVAALENLPIATKIQIAQWLLKRLEKASETRTSWWALGRVAARVPFHGSAHNVLPRETVHAWLPQLMKADWKKNLNQAFAAVMLARMSGDRARDLDEEYRHAIIDKLTVMKAPPIWVDMVTEVKQLDETETRRIFGEALPAGLKLID